MTKHSKYRIENSDFCKLTRQELFEYIVELHDWLERSAWQGLTDDERENLIPEDIEMCTVEYLCKVIEQALKDKNDRH